MVVYKYQLNIIEPTTIYLPKNHKFLHCTSIDNKAFAWIELGEGELKPYQFIVYATGEGFDTPFRHCGTFITQFGFVGHIYFMGEVISSF